MSTTSPYPFSSLSFNLKMSTSPPSPTPNSYSYCWQDNAHGFIGHLQKLPHAALSSTSQIQAPQYQIQIQLLLLLMPTEIVPNPKGVNQLRTLSHFCFGFILKPQCFPFPPSSYQQFSPICRLPPISSHFLRHLTSYVSPFPTVSHLSVHWPHPVSHK